MMNSIVYNDEKKKFIVSPQILDIIKNLSKNDVSFNNEKKQLTNEFDPFDFRIRMNDILSKAIIRLKYLPNEDNDISFDVSTLNSLVQKFNELYPENKREENVYENLNDDVLARLLVVINDIDREEKKYYLIRDLINAKNDYVDNMKYFMDDVSINNWVNEYDKAIISRDTNKMKEMITQVQNMILKEWNNYFLSLEDMNDDNFCFIGHSTNSTKFDGGFYSNYISASLYTPDLTDTYRGGYGFIFAPNNIALASSRDMYVNNYVNNDEAILFYSSVPKIDHPKKVIAETKRQKEENLNNGNGKKTYNEIVLNAFLPIGIFCFTDGSKQFNWNQISAEKLKESFPNLKIYSFDVLKMKKGKDLIEAKLKLLNSIQLKINPNAYVIKENMLDRFDYFFEQFDRLKQFGEYDEKMIKEIFEHNREMLSPFETNPDELFNGKFNKDEIKYILRKNYKYNLDDVLAGKARGFILNNLKQLYLYKDKISGMFEGFETLIDILQKIDVTDEMMNEINSMESLSLITIAKYLSSRLISSINSREKEIKNDLSGYEAEYKKLVTEFEQRSLLEEKYHYYSEIDSNKFFFDIIKQDYQELMDEISKEKEVKMELELKLQILEKKIEMLNHINLEKQYNDTLEHKEYEKAFEEINMNVNELSKHPLLNRKKIKEQKKRLKYFTNRDQEEQYKFEVEKEKEMQNNDNKLRNYIEDVESLRKLIDYSKEKIEKLNEQLITMQDNIKLRFKCDLIEQVPSKIEESNQFMQQYDMFNSMWLNELQNKIMELNNVILKEQGLLNDVYEEKENILKGM